MLDRVKYYLHIDLWYVEYYWEKHGWVPESLGFSGAAGTLKADGGINFGIPAHSLTIDLGKIYWKQKGLMLQEGKLVAYNKDWRLQSRVGGTMRMR